MVKFQNSLSLPSSLFMNSCQVLWCISWVKSRECRLSNFDSRHLRVNHKPMKMPIWSDIKTFHSNWTKCLIYKYISDQHYIFLPPIRSSTQSPCLPSSVIPTSLPRVPFSAAPSCPSRSFLFLFSLRSFNLLDSLYNLFLACKYGLDGLDVPGQVPGETWLDAHCLPLVWISSSNPTAPLFVCLFISIR